MRKIRNISEGLSARFKRIFTRNDDPHGIALGIGLGVFLGVLPGTGPLAALVCAQLLRVNRAAALFGALLTNTWFSLVVLGLAAKAGAVILAANSSELNQAIQAAFKPFSIQKILALPFWPVVFPFLVGFLAVSAASGILAYIVSFFALFAFKELRKKTKDISS